MIVVDTAHGHSAGVLAAVERDQGAVQRGAGDRRQRRHARRRAGADRGRGGRGEDRHRPRQHLHHARGRRRRRAAVQRRAGDRRGVPRARRAGDRRRRHPHLGRHRQGDRRRRRRGDGRQPAGRHRRVAGRGVPLPGPVLQILSRHGQHRRHGARLGGPLLPAGHQGRAEAGAGRHRGPGRLQGAGRGGAAPDGRRPARRHGLHRQPQHRGAAAQRAVPPRSPAPACGRATCTTWRSPARRPTTGRRPDVGAPRRRGRWCSTPMARCSTCMRPWRAHAARLGPDWQRLSAEWRAKQIEYTWVRSLAGPAHHRDFGILTDLALEYVAARHGIADRGAAGRSARRLSRRWRPIPRCRACWRRCGSAGIRLRDPVQRLARHAGGRRARCRVGGAAGRGAERGKRGRVQARPARLPARRRSGSGIRPQAMALRLLQRRGTRSARVRPASAWCGSTAAAQPDEYGLRGSVEELAGPGPGFAPERFWSAGGP